MKLKVGLMKSSVIIQELLDQSKVPWELMKWDHITNDNISVLIVNEKLPLIEKERVIDFLNAGGAVLTFSQYLEPLEKVHLQKKRVSWLKPKLGSIYNKCCIVDIYDDIFVAESPVLQWLDEGLMIKRMSYGEGSILVLPYDLDRLFQDRRIGRKKFYDDRKELPSERVSVVSKGALRKIFTRSLIYLADLRKQYLPLLPSSPHRKGSFIFRIDTDFCDKSEALELYGLLKELDFKATWFVDTADDKMIKDIYAEMTDQDIGLHCHRHKVFKDYQSNYDNIKGALDILEKNGIKPKGFAAPYGEWNPNLNRVLEDLGFEYSSEFGWDYDNLPSYPVIEEVKSNVLQIPVHPVSMGRLIRSHYNIDEIFSYYKNTIDRLVAENLPVIFYYHPHRRRTEILRRIFHYTKQVGLTNISMSDYAKWWINRGTAEYSVEMNEDEFIINKERGDDPVVFYNLNEYGVVESSRNVKKDEMKWIPKKEIRFSANDKIRKFSLRSVLYDYESMKGKAKQ